MSTSARQIKGQTGLKIVMLDDVARRLAFDFNAQMVMEEAFRDHGLSPEDEHRRILQEAAAEDAAKKAGLKYTPPAPKGPGTSRSLAICAYALTATWREDNDEEGMTFREFRRLLPQVKVGHGWQAIVASAMSFEQDPPTGNEPSPENPPTEPGESNAIEAVASE